MCNSDDFLNITTETNGVFREPVWKQSSFLQVDLVVLAEQRCYMQYLLEDHSKKILERNRDLSVFSQSPEL